MTHHHPLHGDHLNIELFRYLCRLNRITDSGTLPFLVPDTVIFTNARATQWFSFDAESGTLGRRPSKQLDRQIIFNEFSQLNKGDKSEICACFTTFHDCKLQSIYFTEKTLKAFLFGPSGGPSEELTALTTAPNSGGGGGGGGNGSSGGESSSSSTPRIGILQKFTEPNKDNNELFQVAWSPRMTYILRRFSKRRLIDRLAEPIARAATFDGPSTLSEEVYAGPGTKAVVEPFVQALVDHVRGADSGRYTVGRCVLFFKVDRQGQMWFIYCTSMRIVVDEEDRNLSQAYALHQRRLQALAKQGVLARIGTADGPSASDEDGGSGGGGNNGGYGGGEEDDDDANLAADDDDDELTASRKRKRREDKLLKKLGGTSSSHGGGSSGGGGGDMGYFMGANLNLPYHESAIPTVSQLERYQIVPHADSPLAIIMGLDQPKITALSDRIQSKMSAAANATNAAALLAAQEKKEQEGGPQHSPYSIMPLSSFPKQRSEEDKYPVKFRAKWDRQHLEQQHFIPAPVRPNLEPLILSLQRQENQTGLDLSEAWENSDEGATADHERLLYLLSLPGPLTKRELVRSRKIGVAGAIQPQGWEEKREKLFPASSSNKNKSNTNAIMDKKSPSRHFRSTTSPNRQHRGGADSPSSSSTTGGHRKIMPGEGISPQLLSRFLTPSLDTTIGKSQKRILDMEEKRQELLKEQEQVRKEMKRRGMHVSTSQSKNNKRIPADDVKKHMLLKQKQQEERRKRQQEQEQGKQQQQKGGEEDEQSYNEESEYYGSGTSSPMSPPSQRYQNHDDRRQTISSTQQQQEEQQEQEKQQQQSLLLHADLVFSPTETFKLTKKVRYACLSIEKEEQQQQEQKLSSDSDSIIVVTSELNDKFLQAITKNKQKEEEKKKEEKEKNDEDEEQGVIFEGGILALLENQQQQSQEENNKLSALSALKSKYENFDKEFKLQIWFLTAEQEEEEQEESQQQASLLQIEKVASAPVSDVDEHDETQHYEDDFEDVHDHDHPHHPEKIGTGSTSITSTDQSISTGQHPLVTGSLRGQKPGHVTASFSASTTNIPSTTATAKQTSGGSDAGSTTTGGSDSQQHALQQQQYSSYRSTASATSSKYSQASKRSHQHYHGRSQSHSNQIVIVSSSKNAVSLPPSTTFSDTFIVAMKLYAKSCIVAANRDMRSAQSAVTSITDTLTPVLVANRESVRLENRFAPHRLVREDAVAHAVHKQQAPEEAEKEDEADYMRHFEAAEKVREQEREEREKEVLMIEAKQQEEEQQEEEERQEKERERQAEREKEEKEKEQQEESASTAENNNNESNDNNNNKTPEKTENPEHDDNQITSSTQQREQQLLMKAHRASTASSLGPSSPLSVLSSAAISPSSMSSHSHKRKQRPIIEAVEREREKQQLVDQYMERGNITKTESVWIQRSNALWVLDDRISGSAEACGFSVTVHQPQPEQQQEKEDNENNNNEKEKDVKNENEEENNKNETSVDSSEQSKNFDSSSATAIPSPFVSQRFPEEEDNNNNKNNSDEIEDETETKKEEEINEENKNEEEKDEQKQENEDDEVHYWIRHREKVVVKKIPPPVLVDIIVTDPILSDDRSSSSHEGRMALRRFSDVALATFRHGLEEELRKYDDISHFFITIRSEIQQAGGIVTPRTRVNNEKMQQQILQQQQISAKQVLLMQAPRGPYSVLVPGVPRSVAESLLSSKPRARGLGAAAAAAAGSRGGTGGSNASKNAAAAAEAIARKNSVPQRKGGMTKSELRAHVATVAFRTNFGVLEEYKRKYRNYIQHINSTCCYIVQGHFGSSATSTSKNKSNINSPSSPNVKKLDENNFASSNVSTPRENKKESSNINITSSNNNEEASFSSDSNQVTTTTAGKDEEESNNNNNITEIKKSEDTDENINNNNEIPETSATASGIDDEKKEEIIIILEKPKETGVPGAGGPQGRIWPEEIVFKDLPPATLAMVNANNVNASNSVVTSTSSSAENNNNNNGSEWWQRRI